MDNNSKQPPSFDRNGDWPTSEGLTKREYYAGLAMNSIIQGRNLNPESVESIKEIAETSIMLADELLRQLNQE